MIRKWLLLSLVALFMTGLHLHQRLAAQQCGGDGGGGAVCPTSRSDPNWVSCCENNPYDANCQDYCDSCDPWCSDYGEGYCE